MGNFPTMDTLNYPNHLFNNLWNTKQMITFEKECYEIRVSKDEWSSEHFGYFTSEVDGLRASKGKGWWGSDGTSRRTTVRVLIFENLDEYDSELLARMKEGALAKLTDDERKILGL